MAKILTSNVHVGGTWYGPSYPDAEVTDDVLARVTNPAAFADIEDAQVPAAGPEAAGVSGGSARRELEQLSKDDLAALADARGVDVPKGATKAEIVDRLLDAS